jgi:hypothetical protein
MKMSHFFPQKKKDFVLVVGAFSFVAFAQKK